MGSVIRDKNEFYICRTFRLGYLWLALFRTLFFKKQVQFYYLIPDRAARRAENLLRRLGSGCPVAVQECPFDVKGMLGPDGMPVIPAANHVSVNRFIDAFDERYLKSWNALSHLRLEKLRCLKEDIKCWIRQSVALGVFDKIMLVDVAQWIARHPQSALCGRDVRVVFEKKHSWDQMIIDNARTRDLKVIVARTSKAINESLLFNSLYQIANIFALWIASFFGNASQRPGPAKGMICTFNEGISNFSDFAQRRNYSLFWLPFSGIPCDRIIISSFYSQEIGDGDLAAGKDKGFEILSLEGFFRKVKKGIPRHCPSAKAIRLAGEYVLEIFRALLGVRREDDYATWKCLSLLFLRLPFWEDFFTRKNIKIFFKPGSLFSHQDIAAKLSGAAVVSFQTSNVFQTTVAHADICDAFFVWGLEYHNVYGTKYSRVRNFVQSGYIFDHVFKALRAESQDLRRQFEKKGVKCILSLFDEDIEALASIGAVGFRQRMLSLYRAFLNYAKDNPDVGIIVKPKKESSRRILLSSPETGGAVSYLEREGRLVFLNARCFPAQAGLASDLAVGLISDSTAAFECWFAGVPAVFCDGLSMKEHNPIYRSGRNKVIFDDVQILFNAVRLFQSGGKRPGWLGDLGPYTGTKDPFRDGKAHARVGVYLKTLLDALDQGLVKGEAIRIANKEYAERFGHDKIFFHGEE